MTDSGAESGTGHLPASVMQFARILRRVGLPVGPSKVVIALNALAVLDISRRDDVFHALHAVFVERRGQSALYKLAFDRFWRPAATAPEVFTADADKPQLVDPDTQQTPRRIDD
ncbi:MAG: VWA domain-containing protein, partial [Rhodospirillaceae bacterium]|nr:VWA domain-containing protein [Rhodospirillaceae bacterium]